MILRLVASPPIPAAVTSLQHFNWASLEPSDTDMLDQVERTIVPWLSRQSTSMVRKIPGLFSSSGDQQEQPFVQVNSHPSIWIK
jgi:hypothetical protein